jgi:hypothetical protein
MKVVVKAKGVENMIKELNSPRVQTRVGAEIVTAMKESIAAGVSPIRGERRFVAYKDAEKYPANRKSRRPVNLFLSGDMLGALKYWILGSRLFIGIDDPTQAAKAKGHQTGANGIPKRRFIPSNKNEEFTVTITRRIRNLYAKILSDIIKRAR